jgi:hypothetical protein
MYFIGASAFFGWTFVISSWTYSVYCDGKLLWLRTDAEIENFGLQILDFNVTAAYIESESVYNAQDNQRSRFTNLHYFKDILLENEQVDIIYMYICIYNYSSRDLSYT